MSFVYFNVVLVQHTLFVVYVLGVSSGYPRNIGFLRILLTHPVQFVSATMEFKHTDSLTFHQISDDICY